MNKLLAAVLLFASSVTYADITSSSASMNISVIIPDRSRPLMIIVPSNDAPVRANGATPVIVGTSAVDPYELLLDGDVVLESPAGIHRHALYGVPRGTHTITLRNDEYETSVIVHVLRAHVN